MPILSSSAMILSIPNYLDVTYPNEAVSTVTDIRSAIIMFIYSVLPTY